MNFQSQPSPAGSGRKLTGGGISTAACMTVRARDAIRLVSFAPFELEYRYLCPPAGSPAWRMVCGRVTLCLIDDPEYAACPPVPDFWAALDLAGCPLCGYALSWFEPGFVPGHRVCCGHRRHAWIVTPAVEADLGSVLRQLTV